MTRTAPKLAALALGAALLLTACGSSRQDTPPAQSPASSSTSSADSGQQLKDMQQKVDAAESAAAQADTDATQNN